MLQTIRNVVTGWFAAVFVGLLIIPFAFWGVNYYFDPAGTRVVAKVDDREIGAAEFQRAYFNYRQQLVEQLGSVDGLDEDMLRREALESLVEQEVLNLTAHKAGLRLGDDGVIQAIAGIEAFQRNGRFDANLYQQALRRAGMSPAEFEARLREDMLLEQLQSAIFETTFVTSRDVEQVARLQAQKRDITYAILDSRPLYEAMEISDEDVAAYYEENRQNYREPERIRIAYLELTVDALGADIVFDEEDLHTYYENNKGTYEDDETRVVTQLYVQLREDADPERVERVEADMDFMQERLAAGDSMESIADEYGGRFGADFELISVGAVPKGAMEPILDETIFSLEEGAASEPVRSSLGMHIVRVDEIRPPRENIFENVRAEVEQDYRRGQAEQRFIESVDVLATLAFEHPDTLEIAAEEVGLEIRTSDWFNRSGGDGIARHAGVVEASFHEEVLEVGHNSDIVELDRNHLVVLRVMDRKPEQQIPLADVREEIFEDMRFERASDATRERGESILAALRDGASLEQVAADFGFEWQHAEQANRNSFDVNRTVLRTAFRMGHPGEDEATAFTGLSIGSGDYVIVGVDAVHDADDDIISLSERLALEEDMRRARMQAVWQLLVKDARSRTDVRIFEENL